jgi:hypothetical protein
MKSLSNFAGQNWLIAPAALAVNEPPPAEIRDQKWLLILSGVVNADLEGNSTHQWLHETLSLSLAPNMDAPLNYAIDRHSIPRPSADGAAFDVKFSVEEWAPFASLSSIYDQDQSDNAGFAVDVWRPTPFTSGPDVLTNQMVGNLFSGIDVDVAVRDTDAWIYRVSYHITLLGKIVFIGSIIQ